MKLAAIAVAALTATWLSQSGELVTRAQAHDIYTELRTKDGKLSCCNNRDCRPAPYRTTATGVKMLVDGKWVAVPESTIQYRSLPHDRTEGGHWCGHGLSIGHPVTVCAILPPNSARAPALLTPVSARPDTVGQPALHGAHRRLRLR